MSGADRSARLAIVGVAFAAMVATVRCARWCARHIEWHEHHGGTMGMVRR